MEDVPVNSDITEPKSKKKIKLVVNASYDENVNFDRFFANYLFVDHLQLMMDKIPPELAHWQILFPDRIHIQSERMNDSDLRDLNFDLIINSWSYNIVPNMLTRIFLELFKKDFFTWSSDVATYYTNVFFLDGHDSNGLLTMYCPLSYEHLGKSIDLPKELSFINIPIKNVTHDDILQSPYMLAQWLAYGDNELKIAKDFNWDDERLILLMIEALDARITKQIKTYNK